MKKIVKSGFIAAAVITEELYRYIFCRGGSPILNRLFDKRGHEEGYYQFRDCSADKLRAAPQERFYIFSRRGCRLSGHYISCGGDGRRIAFIVHGYRSEHAETAGMFLDYYRSRGIDIFAPDNTAAGESEGHLIGFDVYESQDCLDWIDFLRHKFGEDVQIILHGFSMGGATVLKMSDKCPENVKFIVSDSGYMDADSIFKARLGILRNPMNLLNRLIAGYYMEETSTLPSLERSGKPILFVHGREDKTVRFSQGEELYTLYRGEKDCLFPENTRHIESMYTSGDEYARKLDEFIEKYIRR